jgi:hypothetical protein
MKVTRLIAGAIFVCAVLGMVSCQSPEPVTYATFGSEMDAVDAISVAEIWDDSSLDGQTLKVKGTIREVCQTRGCWMTLDAGMGQSMRITFKDYAYFVPKNAGGHEAVVEGTVNLEELTVESLRHFAEESGKSEAEIEAITEPQTQLSLIADGVLIAGVDLDAARDADGENDHGAEDADGEGYDHDAEHGAEHEATN